MCNLHRTYGSLYHELYECETGDIICLENEGKMPLKKKCENLVQNWKRNFFQTQRGGEKIILLLHSQLYNLFGLYRMREKSFKTAFMQNETN